MKKICTTPRLSALNASTILLLASLFLTSCSLIPRKTPEVKPAQAEAKPAQKVNPHPPGSYEHFKFGPYPGTTRTWKNPTLLAAATPQNTSVKIDLSSQRGFLMVGEQIAMDYRVSTGRSTHKTPIGDYRITEKIKDKRSNLYGKILNASGGVVKSNADSRKDKAPEGGKFLGAPMPYWMRLTNTGIGMHEGNVNRRYASHGCIRTQSNAVPIVYEKTKVGTPVTIEN